MSELSPLRRRTRSLAQEVTDYLVAQIRNGVYKPGSKLPTEPVLMAQQGVSRTVIREAVSRLQAAGLAETRHGVGTFVLEPVAKSTLDLSTVVTIRDVLSMLELRISIETETAGLAAQRREESHLDKMRQALRTFDQNVRRGESSVAADFEFHLQIALATGNKYFEDYYRHLGTATIPRTRLDTAQLALQPTETYLLIANREHEYIYDAIARQDVESARGMMRMHLTNSCERLRKASEAVESQTGPIQGTTPAAGLNRNES